jgi:hypothetical protein
MNRPEIVEHAVELIRSGETDLRRKIHSEFPVLTRLGIERVIDIACGVDGSDSARPHRENLARRY